MTRTRTLDVSAMRQRMKRRHLTTATLAEQAGVSRGTVANALHGKALYHSRAVAILKALGMYW